MGERQRFVPEAAFCKATSNHQKAQSEARADERFYAYCHRPSGGGTPIGQPPRQPPEVGQAVSGASRSGGGGPGFDIRNLIQEEKVVLKELNGVRSAPREAQKA